MVALAGDGGVQFSIAELASAKDAQSLPVILMLHDNKGYGEIKSYMVSAEYPPLGVDLTRPTSWRSARPMAGTCGTRDRSRRVEGGAGGERAPSGDEPSMLLFGDDVRDEAVKVVTGA